MLSNIGFPGLILILIIALIIFGPSKLPEIGRSFGKTLKEFKKATKDLTADDDEDSKKEQLVASTTVKADESKLQTK